MWRSRLKVRALASSLWYGNFLRTKSSFQQSSNVGSYLPSAAPKGIAKGEMLRTFWESYGLFARLFWASVAQWQLGCGLLELARDKLAVELWKIEVAGESDSQHRMKKKNTEQVEWETMFIFGSVSKYEVTHTAKVRTLEENWKGPH